MFYFICILKINSNRISLSLVCNAIRLQLHGSKLANKLSGAVYATIRSVPCGMQRTLEVNVHHTHTHTVDKGRSDDASSAPAATAGAHFGGNQDEERSSNYITQERSVRSCGALYKYHPRSGSFEAIHILWQTFASPAYWTFMCGITNSDRHTHLNGWRRKYTVMWYCKAGLMWMTLW